MKKISTLVILLALCISAGHAQTKSSKRGLGYGYHSPQDMEVISKGISWWYNWYQAPDAGVKAVYKNYGVEFVPMIWGNSWNGEDLKNTLENDPEIQYLLGFNEPNFLDQANMTPSQAAARWPEVEAIADQYGLELIGPAVNYCGDCVSENGVTYSDPVAYLDAFFKACQDCRVDYIAVHWYGCNSLEWFLSLFDKYNKPLWVTEFACWENRAITLEEQKSNLINMVDLMESNPKVFRYAWFTGRAEGENIPHISLLGADGKLTELGELYVNMPVHDPSFFKPVPARIQAQEYQQMQGIQLELTQDESGLMNVGFLEAGDWIEYNIEVAEAQAYYLSLRTAGTATGRLAILLNGEAFASFEIPETKGWQNWQTIHQQVQLPAGKHTLRLQVVQAGYNINWLEIGTEEPGAVTGIEEEGDLQHTVLYPNPSSGNSIGVTLNSQLMGQMLDAEVYSASGHQVLHTRIRVGQKGKLELQLPGTLAAGIYLLKLQSDKGVKNLKFVVH